MRKIERDKWKHFILAIPLGAVLELTGWYFLPHRPILFTVSAFMTLVVICYGFELFSKITGKGHYEVMDAIAGILGGSIGIGITWLFL